MSCEMCQYVLRIHSIEHSYLHAAVESEVAWLDLLDRASVAFGDGFVVLGGDFDLTHSEGGDLGEAVGDSILDLAKPLFVEPEIEGVASRELERDVVASRSLFAVVGNLFE